MIHKMLDWIYPPKCMVCSQLIALSTIQEYNATEKEETICFSRWFCTECSKTLFIYIDAPFCSVCGVPLEIEEVCENCWHKKSIFIQNRSLFVYEGEHQHLIHRMKYGKRKVIGQVIGKIMAQRWENYDKEGSIDCIIPIPMRLSKQRIRGFNQAELMADAIGAATGIPVAKRVIFRTKDTIPQSQLSPREREMNIHNAFAMDKKFTNVYKRILLIDDIYTTGSTLRECSRVLLQNGISEIYCYTYSITVKKSNESIDE